MTTPVQASFQNCNALARVRDARIEWLLGQHPVTAAMLVWLGWFPNKGKALRRLNRLVGKGRIRHVGTVCRNAGRPEHVFCNWRPKVDDLRHEIELTEVCLRLDAAEILRGPHVTDHAIRPDAQVWINGQVYYLELDRGTMGYAQIARRLRQYTSFTHFVLWICPTEARRESVRVRAEGLRQTALFTTFAEILGSPHETVWWDCGGRLVALPHQISPNEEKGTAFEPIVKRRWP